MTAVLDAPTVAPVELDETVWGEVATCARCPQPAEYHVRATCCPATSLICGDCEASLNTKWSMQIIVTGGIQCTHCRTAFYDVDTAVKVRPV